jgi:hypothetical protein
MESLAPVALLWTGGWDSTFRLLTLLLELRRPVAPIYLFDVTRASAPVELATMTRIREALAEAHPHTLALLRPVTVVRVADLASDPEIEDVYDRLAARVGIGTQYAWLARYLHQQGPPGLELCCDHIHLGASGLLVDCTVPTRSAYGDPTFRVPEAHPDRDVALLFRDFTFPLIATSRAQMADIVARKGWTPWMHMTWFCHRPVRGVRPCGLCNPCVAVITEGFAWRVPRDRRALSAVYRVTWLPLRIRARRWWLRARALRATDHPFASA